MTNSTDIHLNDYAVVAQGLGKQLGEVKAVIGIDLALSKGEIYGFLGPNGAGKTTVVRMLTTLLIPTAGSAFVAGHDVLRNPQEVRLRIGAALQTSHWTTSRLDASCSVFKGVSMDYLVVKSNSESWSYPHWSILGTR